jgi:hypothetical protein
MGVDIVYDERHNMWDVMFTPNAASFPSLKQAKDYIASVKKGYTLECYLKRDILHPVVKVVNIRALDSLAFDYLDSSKNDTYWEFGDNLIVCSDKTIPNVEKARSFLRMSVSLYQDANKIIESLPTLQSIGRCKESDFSLPIIG